MFCVIMREVPGAGGVIGHCGAGRSHFSPEFGVPPLLGDAMFGRRFPVVAIARAGIGVKVRDGSQASRRAGTVDHSVGPKLLLTLLLQGGRPHQAELERECEEGVKDAVTRSVSPGSAETVRVWTAACSLRTDPGHG